jgi:hypothetical protein
MQRVRFEDSALNSRKKSVDECDEDPSEKTDEGIE